MHYSHDHHDPDKKMIETIIDKSVDALKSVLTRIVYKQIERYQAKRKHPPAPEDEQRPF